MKTTQSPAVATHTPTPWRVGQYDGELAIYDAEQYKLASLPLWRGEAAREAEANAAFIVRACNSHAQLVAALEEAKANLLSYMVYAEEMKKIGRGHEPLTGKHGMSPQYLINHINAALSAAKE